MIVYGKRVIYDYIRLSLGLNSISLNVQRTWKLSVLNEKSVEVKPCEGGLQLADIGTKNVSETDLTPRMKYITVRLEK